MKMCCEPGCTQLTYGKEVCYFHNKQRTGLIPVKDREFYLQKQDLELIEKPKTDQVELFYKYFPTVRRMAVSIMSRFPLHVSFRDALQEVYLAWWKSCLAGVPVRKYEPYLAALIKNTAISLLRREKFEVEFEDREIEECSCTDKDGDPVCELQKSLRKINKSLTTVDRYLLRNYILGEKRMTLTEIGNKFGVSKVAIYHRVNKIKNKIKELFNAECVR